MTQAQYQQTVAAQERYENDQGQTQEEYEAWFEAEKAEMFAQFQAIESAFDSGALDNEYAEWLMEPGRHRIGNGNDLVEAMENTTNQEQFIKWKAGV